MDKPHEESRMQFEEKAANKLNFSISTVIASRDGDSYDSEILSIWWDFWQASRASIVVELPEQKEDRARNCSSDDIAYGFNQGVGACRNSIRSIGLSIKGE